MSASRHALAVLVVLAAATAAPAQAPRGYAPAPTYWAYPTYRYVPAATYYRAPAATPVPTYRAAPVYVEPGGYRLYGATPFQRYRSAIDRGIDPNWGTRRGMRLYKPWLY